MSKVCEGPRCNKTLTPKKKRGGMDKRFCSAKCRFAFWSRSKADIEAENKQLKMEIKKLKAKLTEVGL